MADMRAPLARRLQPTGSILKPCRIRPKACILEKDGKDVRDGAMPVAAAIAGQPNRGAKIEAEVKG